MNLIQFSYPGETRYLLFQEVVHKFKIQFHSSLKDVPTNSFQSELESLIQNILNGITGDNTYDVVTQNLSIHIIKKEWKNREIASNLIPLSFHTQSYTLMLSLKNNISMDNQVTAYRDVSSISKDSDIEISLSDDCIEKVKRDSKGSVVENVSSKKLCHKRKMSIETSSVDEKENSSYFKAMIPSTSAKTDSSGYILQEKINLDGKDVIIGECNHSGEQHPCKKIKLEKKPDDKSNCGSIIICGPKLNCSENHILNNTGVKVKKKSKTLKKCFIM